MKRILMVGLVMILVAVVLSGCGAPQAVHEATEASVKEATEMGDMVYLPINRNGLPERNIEVIFAAIDDWKNDHPDRRVLSFQILYMQNTYAWSTSNYTYGVSLLTELIEQ